MCLGRLAVLCIIFVSYYFAARFFSYSSFLVEFLRSYMYLIISSVNKDILTSSLAVCIPLIFSSHLTSLVKTSSTLLNRYGASGQSWCLRATMQVLRIKHKQVFWESSRCFTAELMHMFFVFSKNTSVSRGSTHNLTVNEIYCLCRFIILSAYETRSFAQFLSLRLVPTTASNQEWMGEWPNSQHRKWMDVVKDFFFAENLNELVNFIENQSNDLINKLLSAK